MGLFSEPTSRSQPRLPCISYTSNYFYYFNLIILKLVRFVDFLLAPRESFTGSNPILHCPEGKNGGGGEEFADIRANFSFVELSNNTVRFLVFLPNFLKPLVSIRSLDHFSISSNVYFFFFFLTSSRKRKGARIRKFEDSRIEEDRKALEKSEKKKKGKSGERVGFSRSIGEEGGENAAEGIVYAG